jgi:hypothetical protein
MQHVKRRPNRQSHCTTSPHHGEALTDLFLEQFEPLRASEYYAGQPQKSHLVEETCRTGFDPQ